MKMTKVLKKGIALLMVLSMITVLFSACGDSNKLDLFEGLEVTFSGFDGEGYFSYNIDPEKMATNLSNSDQKNFLQENVTYVIDPNGGAADGELSNGDQVTVVAQFSESQAKEYGIKIKETSHIYTVEDLYERINTDQSNYSDEALEGLKEVGSENIDKFYNFVHDSDNPFPDYFLANKLKTYTKKSTGNEYRSYVFYSGIQKYAKDYSVSVNDLKALYFYKYNGSYTRDEDLGDYLPDSLIPVFEITITNDDTGKQSTVYAIQFLEKVYSGREIYNHYAYYSTDTTTVDLCVYICKNMSEVSKFMNTLSNYYEFDTTITETEEEV